MSMAGAGSASARHRAAGMHSLGTDHAPRGDAQPGDSPHPLPMLPGTQQQNRGPGSEGGRGGSRKPWPLPRWPTKGSSEVKGRQYGPSFKWSNGFVPRCSLRTALGPLPLKLSLVPTICPFHFQTQGQGVSRRRQAGGPAGELHVGCRCRGLCGPGCRTSQRGSHLNLKILKDRFVLFERWT